MDFLCILQLQPHYRTASNWTDATNKVLDAHWDYLVNLHGRGKIKFVSRTNYEIDNEANRGLAVYVAASEAEALEMMNNDPCIINGVMLGELHPLTVFMLGDQLVNR